MDELNSEINNDSHNKDKLLFVGFYKEWFLITHLMLYLKEQFQH